MDCSLNQNPKHFKRSVNHLALHRPNRQRFRLVMTAFCGLLIYSQLHSRIPQLRRVSAPKNAQHTTFVQTFTRQTPFIKSSRVNPPLQFDLVKMSVLSTIANALDTCVDEFCFFELRKCWNRDGKICVDLYEGRWPRRSRTRGPFS